MSEKWRECQDHHSKLTSKLISNSNKEISTEQWILCKKNESFSDFAKRCFEAKSPGIWLYQNDRMLSEAVNSSAIVGTSVGVDAFDDVLSNFDKLRIPELTVYAFENKPNDIKSIADKHTTNVIPCEIDRVVVSREINISAGTISVKLGLDPSESIMIYDKNGLWSEVLKTNNDPHLIVTSNSEMLNYTLKKKLYGKNLTHKLLCQFTAIGKEPNTIANLPLCSVIKQTDVVYVKSIFPLITTAIVVNIFSEWSASFSKQSCLDVYDEITAYSKKSMSTVINDTTDTVGRIIHLETYESAQKDLSRLVSNLETLKKSMYHSIAPKILLFLKERIGNLETKKVIEAIDEVIQALSNNND